MKKTYFFFLNILIIIFILASLASAQVKTSNSATTVKAASTQSTLPAQSKAKPVSPGTPAQVKQPSASLPANVTVQGQAKPAQPQQPAAVPSAANVTPTATTAVAVPASSPALNQAGTYSYNPVGKPDPFRPFIVIEKAKPKVAAAQQKKKEEPQSIFPLQRADTTNYKVVGIVGSEEHRMAIAEDAKKKFYPLLIGTRIGLRSGKVVEILADRVIVEEYEKDKAKRVILKLRKN